MKRIILNLVTGLIILSFCQTCYYLNDDELNPPQVQCDTTNITFNGTILNILGANCLLCHSNAAAIDNGSGIYLDTYEGVKTRAKMISGALNHTGGYFPMPKNAPKLDPCLIQKFDIWVRNDMPEN
jgi:hypothetical protein